MDQQGHFRLVNMDEIPPQVHRGAVCNYYREVYSIPFDRPKILNIFVDKKLNPCFTNIVVSVRK